MSDPFNFSGFFLWAMLWFAAFYVVFVGPWWVAYWLGF